MDLPIRGLRKESVYALDAKDGRLLGQHLAHCGALRGPLRAAWTGLSRCHRLLAERALTATLLIALVAGTAWLVL